MYRFLFLAISIMAVFLTSEGRAQEQMNAKHVTQVAKTAKRPAGTPQYSDVCFSSRWLRPKSAKAPHDTLTSARAFHAMRLDWVYTQDKEWIRKMKTLGFHMGIAMRINWFKKDLSVQRRDGK